MAGTRAGVPQFMPTRPAALLTPEQSDLARCTAYDPRLFFHPEQERGADRRRRANAAKAVCRVCPIRLPCLEVAIANNEQFGVFGGLTPEERATR